MAKEKEFLWNMKLKKHRGDNTVAGKRERRKGDKNAFTEEQVLNRPFARSGHMVQRNSYQSSPTILCFESPTALFASQCNLFGTMWPDPAKGLFWRSVQNVSIFLPVLKLNDDIFLEIWKVSNLGSLDVISGDILDGRDGRILIF